MLVLSAAGLGVSIYLTWLKWAGKGALFCVAGAGCDIVQASRYAIFLGVPTALWGALLYAAIGALGGLGLTANRWLAAFLLAAAGVGVSVYLTFLSLFDRRWRMRVLSRVGRDRRRAARRPDLAAAAHERPEVAPSARVASRHTVLSPAAAAVVFGAFVFAAPSSAPAGYQLALARHLKETKAVMYGAYW